MRKSRFVEYMNWHNKGLPGSLHADTVVYFEAVGDICAIYLANGTKIMAEDTYETIKERINEAMQ